MENKIEVVKEFFLESLVILLPLIISYLLLGMWLSDVTDFGRAYVLPSGVTDSREIYESVVKYGWIEFDTMGQGFKNYSFEFSHIFWGGLISVILLILIGKLIHVRLSKLIGNRVNIKK
ncbi:hypothetical protein [Bacillus safensis]|uniref:hypothetical protein n=1 Tax=Bacillus safensis TaxID=561879 RepID=UPI002E2D1AE0|nr:hypothetical protein [Bacillus safensis]MED5224142.1 hypothetical protein [Bacillus safensis]